MSVAKDVGHVVTDGTSWPLWDNPCNQNISSLVVQPPHGPQGSHVIGEVNAHAEWVLGSDAHVESVNNKPKHVLLRKPFVVRRKVSKLKIKTFYEIRLKFILWKGGCFLVFFIN